MSVPHIARNTPCQYETLRQYLTSRAMIRNVSVSHIDHDTLCQYSHIAQDALCQYRTLHALRRYRTSQSA
eukprot:2836888-Rhodomonas_salina.1